MGFYYKQGNASDVIHSPKFSSKEQCISWAENIRVTRLEDKDVELQNLYECGKNCKLSNIGAGIYSCKQTFDGADWKRGDFGD